MKYMGVCTADLAPTPADYLDPRRPPHPRPLAWPRPAAGYSLRALLYHQAGCCLSRRMALSKGAGGSLRVDVVDVDDRNWKQRS